MRRCVVCQLDYPDALEFCPKDGVKLPPLPGETQAFYDPLIGSTVDGRYQIESILGEGGMGMVYAGRHAIIDKRVAIKVLRREAASDESSAQRFLAEAKAASKIGQQNIVDITDFGVLPDGHAYFVMEFLNGPTLGKVMATAGPLPPARAATIAAQIARGLSAAHGKGIVHRDLKPENVFVLERDGTRDFVKIVDFGIARDASTKKRLTVAGMVMGTPEYMAPEQASGQETDHRVDQYALGCILYEMLTGQVPFRGDNPMQTLTKHVFDVVVPPSRLRRDLTIPAEIEAVVMKAVAKNRDDRFESLEQMMLVLQRLAGTLQGISVPASARAASSSRGADDERPTTVDSDSAMNAVLGAPRRRALTFGAVVLVICVAGIVAYALTSKPRVVIAPIAPTPAPVVVPVVKPVVPATAGDVEIELRSVPPGADVFLKDEHIGVTPVKTLQPKSTSTTLTFLFRRAGFHDTTHDVASTKDADVEVVLPREPTPPKKTLDPGRRSPVVSQVGVPQSSKPSDGKSDRANHPKSELRNPFDNP